MFEPENESKETSWELRTEKRQAVLFHEPDDHLAERPFSARLAEENGWTEEKAQRVLREYRRFAYLCSLSDTGEMTPSVDVDEAWHLHLAYTRDYWGPFAEAVGRPLQHGPSPGGSDVPSPTTRIGTKRRWTPTEGNSGSPPADICPPAEIGLSSLGQFVKLAPETASAVRHAVETQRISSI